MNQSAEWLPADAQRMLAAWGVAVFFLVFALFLAAPQRTRRIRYIAGPFAASIVSAVLMIAWDLPFSPQFVSWDQVPEAFPGSSPCPCGSAY